MSDILKEELAKYGLEKDKFLSLLDECDGLIAGSFPLYIYLKERGKVRYIPDDIDIFIDGYKPYKKICDQLFKEYGYSIDFKNNTKYDYMDVSKMFGFKKDKKRIQVILTKCNPKNYLRTFDFTCCQTFVDNQLGKVFTLDDMTKEMKTSLTCKNYLANWHWNNFGKRFRKYLKRGFSFYIQGMDITASLIVEKGDELKTIEKILEQFDQEPVKTRAPMTLPLDCDSESE